MTGGCEWQAGEPHAFGCGAFVYEGAAVGVAGEADAVTHAHRAAPPRQVTEKVTLSLSAHPY